MRTRGFTLVEVSFVIIVILMVLLFLPMLPRTRERSRESRCASNLRQIHTGMYEYSQDYDGRFPQIGFGSGKIVGEDKADRNLKPGAKDDPFKDFPVTADHSVSQNMWLVIRNDFAQPEILLCPSTEAYGRKATLRDDKADASPSNFVNFPWAKDGTVMSYSFVQPWSTFTGKHTSADTWHADADPRAVIGADANNGGQPDYRPKGPSTQPSELKDFMNSTNHNGDGQNVMYGDGHVTFEKSPYVAIEGDNIYTALPADYKGRPGDTPGILSVRPRDQFDPKIDKSDQWDTVLIPNKDANLEKWERKP